jgi:hypothetical protein
MSNVVIRSRRRHFNTDVNAFSGSKRLPRIEPEEGSCERRLRFCLTFSFIGDKMLGLMLSRRNDALIAGPGRYNFCVSKKLRLSSLFSRTCIRLFANCLQVTNLPQGEGGGCP